MCDPPLVHLLFQSCHSSQVSWQGPDLGLPADADASSSQIFGPNDSVLGRWFFFFFLVASDRDSTQANSSRKLSFMLSSALIVSYNWKVQVWKYISLQNIEAQLALIILQGSVVSPFSYSTGIHFTGWLSLGGRKAGC